MLRKLEVIHTCGTSPLQWALLTRQPLLSLSIPLHSLWSLVTGLLLEHWGTMVMGATASRCCCIGADLEPMFIGWFEGNIQNTHYSHWISNMCMTNGSLTFDWLPHLCVVCEFAFIKTFVIMMLIMYSVAAGFHSVRWQPVRSTFKENLQGL